MVAEDSATAFVERINAHDVTGLIELMTPDHSFVDSLGARFVRPAIEVGWREYFRMVPDYWIMIERSFSDGETTVLVGRAGGTYVPRGGLASEENRWEAPAAWVVKRNSGKVAEWRIYSDNEPIREKMRGTVK